MQRSDFIQLLKRQPRLGMGLSDDLENLGDLSEKLGQNTIVALNQKIAESFQGLINQASFFEKRLEALNKNFGISSVAASQLNKSLEVTRDRLNKDVNVAFKMSNLQIQQYASNIKKLLPTLNQANEALAGSKLQRQLIRSQRILKTSIGLSDQQTNSYTQFAAASDRGVDAQLRFTQALADSADGVKDGVDNLGVFKMVTEEIAEAGSAVQLQYGRLPGSLEGAVLKAKKLGFSLQDVTKIGESLLDIESSIGAELEFQLLSGRRLVDTSGQSLTNKFREATLQGNATKQAETLNEIITSQGDVLENNLFARKQLAKTLGIEEKQLASAIQKQKILQKASKIGLNVNIDDEGALKAAAQTLQEKGEIDAKEFEQLQKDLDTRTTDDILKQQLTVQREQLMLALLNNENAEGLRSMLSNVGEIADSPMFNVESGATETALGIGKIGEAVAGPAIKAGLSLFDAIKSGKTKEIVKAVKGAFGDKVLAEATQESAVVTPKARGGAVMAGSTYMVGEQGPEMFIPASDGSIVSNSSTTNGTAIKTDNSDVVAAIDALSRAILNQPAKSFNGGR